MDGVLNVNKPCGPTSHDVVALIRRVARVKRVGHAGTLDPLATGVLIVCLGSATRIIEYLGDWRKKYRATAVLGIETDTEDATGQVTREADCSKVTREMIENVVPRFTGEIMQIPPMVSAVHHEGRRLYDLAREGKVVEREPRPVEVYSLDLVGFEPGKNASFTFDVECSSGTYVRTLCSDIGRALGCGAHMSALARTAVGRFRVEDAVSLEVIEQKAAEVALVELLHSMDEVLDDMPSVEVSRDDAERIANGVVLPAERLSLSQAPGAPLRVHDPDGRLIAIGILRQADYGLELKPEKVFAEPHRSGDR